MQEKMNNTQHEILNHLLANKSGLSINELAGFLAISRNAVQQHIFVLERDGYLRKKQTSPTAGRPAGIYELTGQGINYFPKQYAWFSELLLNHLTEEISPSRMPAYMKKLGLKLATELWPRFAEKSASQRLDELKTLMVELGYQAEVVADNTNGETALEAVNCVFHDLARTNPANCEFDIALISYLLGKPIAHTCCMAKGDGKCRFLVEESEAQ